MKRWLCLGMVLTLGFLLGMLGFSLWDKTPTPVERVVWSPEAQWIAPQEPSYRFYARHTFYAPDTVEGAWLRVSADNDFNLYMNGQLLTKENSILSSATAGLAGRLSDPFQRFNDALPYKGSNSPEILMGSPRDWKVAAYVDLTSYLHSGKNVIALQVQKGQTNPRFVLQGEVYGSDQSAITLTTGVASWRVSTLGENHQQVHWFDSDFPDQRWQEARIMGAVQEATYSRLSQNLFVRLLQGSWISGIESAKGEVWLRGHWQVPQTHQRAFIRFAGDGEYALLVNGLLVNRYDPDEHSQLHMYEVTNLLKTGANTLAVRLARPLDKGNSTLQNKPLRFLLDGWVETSSGKITALVATDSTWSSLAQPVLDWSEGVGQGKPAVIIGPPDPQPFQRTFEGDAYLLNYPNSLARQSLWQLGGIGFALVFAWSLGRFGLEGDRGWWDSVSAGAGLLLPGTLFLVGIGLLKHRYAEAERGLLFSQPQSTPLIFLGFVGIVCVTLLWVWTSSRPKDRHSRIFKTLQPWGLWFLLGLITSIGLALAQQLLPATYSPIFLLLSLGCLGIVPLTLLYQRLGWHLNNWDETTKRVWLTWGQWFVLILILSIGLSLRVYHLDAIDLSFDESVSLDATRGIHRTGAPEEISGIWYTRSPAYHYILALWLSLLGDSIINARVLSIFLGTTTLVTAFIFTRNVTGKVWVALVVTAILAIDPWEIMFSRAVRFYQPVQGLSLLSFWLFFKGFIDRKGKGYQHSFFVAITLGMLHQELAIILVPCFFIGFLFFYRPFRLPYDWSIVIGAVVTMVVAFYNITFFFLQCATPWLSLSTTTDSITKLHLLDVTSFITGFFVGFNRMSTIYSFFFFLGFIYFLKRREGKLLYLFSSIFLYLIVVTILVMQFGNRYVYPIYPIFIMLSVYSLICLMEFLGQRFQLSLADGFPLKSISFALVGLLLISNLEPSRLLAGYNDAIFKRHTLLLEYYRAHRQPGDVFVSATPSAAAVVLGGLDYYLLPALRTDIFSFDSIYLHNGRVLDRWAGGVAISNVDQMSKILETSKRVWIHQDDGKFEALEVQDSEFADYLETVGKPVVETFGTRLRLWEPKDGLLPRVPNQGKDLGTY